MRKILFILIITSNITGAQAQPPVSSDWMTLQLPVSAGDRWQWLNEYSYRTIGQSASLYQLFLRTGAKYLINPHWSAASSIDMVTTRTSSEKDNKNYGREWRIWQELTYKSRPGKKMSWQNRFRIEERFFQQTQNTGAYTSVRFRCRLSATRAITSRWSVQLADEVMEERTRAAWGAFNQNRIYLNSIHQLNTTLQAQAGYYIVLRSASRLQQVFALTVQQKLAFRGGKKHA